MIFKVLSLILSFIKAEKKFSPQKNELIIFDYDSDQLLSEIILGHKNYTVLPNRSEYYILILFLSLFEIRNHRYSYKIAFLKYTKAKYILYFHDDYTGLVTPAKVTNCKLFHIQNGRRGEDCIINFKKNLPKFEKYFAWSKNWKDYCSNKMNIPFEVIGSIKNNFFKKTNLLPVKRIQFISHWSQKGQIAGNHKTRLATTWKEDVEDSTIKIIDVVKEFAKKYNLSIEILLRRKGMSDEENNFYKDLGFNIEQKFLNKKDFWKENYLNAKNDAIIVADSSECLAYELMKRNFRVGIFSARSVLTKTKHYHYGWPSATSSSGSFWTNIPDKKNMMEILEYLKNVNEKEWENEISLNNQIIDYDYDNLILKKSLRNQGIEINL